MLFINVGCQIVFLKAVADLLVVTDLSISIVSPLTVNKPLIENYKDPQFWILFLSRQFIPYLTTQGSFFAFSWTCKNIENRALSWAVWLEPYFVYLGNMNLTKQVWIVGYSMVMTVVIFPFVMFHLYGNKAYDLYIASLLQNVDLQMREIRYH